MENNEESGLIIYSDLGLEKVVLKFRTATIGSEWAQSTYQQIFVGKLEKNHVELRDTYGSDKNRIVYKIEIFENETGSTHLKIRSNHYEKQQVAKTLLQALVLPIGLIILFLCFFCAHDEELFLSAFVTGTVMVVLPLLYKVKPFTKEDFLKEEMIKKISKLVSATGFDSLQNGQISFKG